jgi:hypothetical protein
MSNADTVKTLRAIGDLLEGLPGVPLVYVSTMGTSASLHLPVWHGDDTTRERAMDALCSLLTRVERRTWPSGPPTGLCLYADGHLGDTTVTVATHVGFDQAVA